MRKRLLGIMASAAVIAAACGGATPSSTPAASTEPGASAPAETPAATAESDMADEQILHIDLGNEPPTLDPTQAQDSTSIAVIHALSRPLVYFDKDLKVVPELAESYDISDDAKTLTFHLRDAKYSNGDPIVAGDLVYSWRRLVDPRIAAPYSYVAAEVDGAPDLLAMAAQDPLPSDTDIDAALDKLGVAAPDDKTFVVTLNQPATYFLTAASLWVFGPIEESWITQPGATEAANYVSSGPYILDSWDHNSQITLKPNPNWYGEPSKVSEIDMTMTAEPAQAQAAYEAGELDMVVPPSEDIRRILGDPVLKDQVLQVPLFSIYYFVFNNQTGPTTNKDFRIALTQAVDKQGLIDATFSGIGQVANSFVMPGIPGYQADLDPYPYDVAAAKEHMTAALSALGVASAADLGKISLAFNTGSNHETKVAYLAEAWRQAFGLETEQIGSEWSVFLTDRTAGKYTISRDGWGADYPHANNQLSGLFTCGGGNNDGQYCNPDFDKLLAQAAVEPDQDKQVALYNQAQTLLMDDAAILPLRFSTATYEVAPYVGGVIATGSDSQLPGDLFYETIYIKKH